jgi:hypothetical protein
MEQQGIPISLVILFLGVILGAMAFIGLIIATIFFVS